MPTELLSKYHIWADPALWQGIAGVALLIALGLGYYKYPQKFKRAWKKVLKLFSQFHRMLLMLIAFIATVAFVFVYFSVDINSLQNASPALYGWVVEYERVFYLVFWGLVGTTFWLKSASHGDRQDDGIVNDLDSEKRHNQTDLIIGQMAIERRKDSEKIQKALEALDELSQLRTAVTKLTELYVGSQNTIAEIKGVKEGRQKTEEIYTGPEKRAFVRNDPTIPLTEEEVLAKILPVTEETVTTEKSLPPENVSEPEEDVETKKKPRKLSWKHTSDWDAIIWGGKTK